MNILHIACTNGDMCNGVQVVVPQHLNAQGKYANVKFVNISNIKVDCECEQITYNKEFLIASLKAPFNKPDIVIFHECYRIQYIKIAKELCRLGVPYVIIPHGELSKDAQKKKFLKKKVANFLIFNNFIKRAVGVQLLSETEKRNTNFGKYKFVGTNGIIIPDKFKERFNSSGIKFLYIGRLDVYHKGLDIMIEGIAGCAEFFRMHKCTLDIYGPDILGRLDQVKKLVNDNGIGDIVKLRSPVFGEEKEKILLEADVFIQTSRFEGMPMGILEALSYGLPCLVTEGTTLGTFITEKDAGWSSGSSSDMVTENIIKAVHEAEKLSEKSINARKNVIADFSWAMIAKKTIEKYYSII